MMQTFDKKLFERNGNKFYKTRKYNRLTTSRKLYLDSHLNNWWIWISSSVKCWPDPGWENGRIELYSACVINV